MATVYRRTYMLEPKHAEWLAKGGRNASEKLRELIDAAREIERRANAHVREARKRIADNEK